VLTSDRTKVPPTLLLADDSVTIQRVIELTFADEDVRVVAVSDGGEAIAMLDRTPPDIVLADVGMPGQNGYEVARHIKTSPRLAHIPILLLTGAFEPIDQVRAAEVGCDGVLAKPFEPQLVIARVRELLARSGVAPERVEAGPQPASLTMPSAAVPATRPGDAALADVSGAAPVAARNAPAASEARHADGRSKAAAPAEFDNYLDRLDTALSHFRAPGPPVLNPSEASSRPVPAQSGHAPAEATPSMPNGAALSSLADAFTALLAAERSAPAPAAPPAWPVALLATGLPTSTPPVVPEDMVEQVTQRVLEQLSDRVVRETVTDIVSSVAERLVREEIERIKRSIPGRGDE